MYNQFLFNVIPNSILLSYSMDHMTYKFFINNKRFISSIYFFWGFSESQLKFFSDLLIVDFPIFFMRFLSVYNIVSLLYNIRFILKFFLDSNLTISSITKCYPCASWFERECWDMFGVFYSNNLDLRRILNDSVFNFKKIRYLFRFNSVFKFNKLKKIKLKSNLKKSYSTLNSNNTEVENNTTENNSPETNTNIPFFIIEKTVVCNEDLHICTPEEGEELLKRYNSISNNNKLICSDVDLFSISKKKKLFDYLFFKIILFLFYLPFYLVQMFFLYVFFYCIVFIFQRIYIYCINYPIIYINTYILGFWGPHCSKWRNCALFQ